MTLVTVDINDAELRVARDTEIVVRTPGYAVLDNTRSLRIGKEAAALAHVHPRKTNDQFWRELNQVPMTRLGKRCRHHADLAFLHLQHARAGAGDPSEAIYTVPGTMNREQLALLLGISDANHMKCVALADSAVAAGAAYLDRGHYTHVVLHRHEAVVTELIVDEHVTRGMVTSVPGLGVNRFNAAAIGRIVDAFITEARFDPLHRAETEQLLYDHLDEWLQMLATRNEIQVNIEYLNARFDARITQAAVIEATTPLFETLLETLSAPLVADSRLAQLPGFQTSCPAAIALPEDAVFRGVDTHSALLAERSNDGLNLIATLPASDQATLGPPAAASTAPAVPIDTNPVTHLLVNHTAYAIGASPLFLSARGHCSRHEHPDSAACATLNEHGAELTVLGHLQVVLNGVPINGTTPIGPGDHIAIPGSGGFFVALTVVE